MKRSLKYSPLRGALLALTTFALSLTTQADDYTGPKPSAPQLAWQQAELGVIFHYDLHIFQEGRYIQKQNRKSPIKDVNIFNPTKLDTDQWLKTAKEMGATFAIFTASHETGFCMWQTESTPYSLKSTKWGDGKRDIVAEFIASCKKYDIKPGIYIGTRWNSHQGVLDFKVTKNSTISQKEYNSMIEKQVEEICSNYGPLFELWFDGGAHGPKQGGPDVLGIFEKHQPNCLFYHSLERADARWGGSESGKVPYPCWSTFPFKSTGAGESARAQIAKNRFALLKHGDPNGTYWMPAMSDAPLRNHEWFWNKNEEKKLYPLKSLVDMYYKSVGHNSTLIMGLVVDPDGLVPEADVKRCQEWGQAIKKAFANKVAETKGEGNSVELNMDKEASFDHLVLQEDIEHGERVRAYTVEAKQGDEWKKIASGSCIGHKRIHRFKQTLTASAVRVKLDKSVASLRSSHLACFSLKNST